MLIQDGTGSRLATWPGTVKWPAGTAPTLTTTAAGSDICSFYWDGTNLLFDPVAAGHENLNIVFAAGVTKVIGGSNAADDLTLLM